MALGAEHQRCAPRRSLGDFLGTWRLERLVKQRDGETAHFSGKAVWTAQGDGALYCETGLLRLPGRGAFRAERRYRWGADLGVFFEDGRFFHSVPPLGGAARHWCEPDQYDVVYDFAGWPDWQAVWRVSGPRKAYEMRNNFTRPEAM